MRISRSLSFASALLIMWMTAMVTPPFAHAADEPVLDAKAYPQDTPQKALGSIIKALEATDFKYFATHLITAEDKALILKKYESLEKFVESRKGEEKAAAIKAQTVLMKQLLETNKVTESEENKIKIARFTFGTKIIQFEKNADGLWQLNSRVKQATPEQK
jgi:hypothetical protein